MKKLLTAVVLAALAGCASVPKPAADAADVRRCDGEAAAACAEWIDAVTARADALRQTENAASSGFAFQGRVAISQGGQGGNATLDWQAASLARYRVELSAPVTAQTWQLDVAPGKTVIAGMKGGPRQGDDPAALLKAATGWDIPVRQMRYWVQALPAPGGGARDFVFSNAAQPRVLGFEQDGWQLKFEGAGDTGLPQRVFARNGANQVRLVIDQWTRTPAQ